VARGGALLAEASLRSRIATGPEAGQRWRRLGDRVEPAAGGGRPESDAAPLARHAEMSLHAGVCVPAHDRRRLERLCRYVARPPVAHDRLEQRSDGRLALRLKTRWRDGTTHILIERRDLIDRLAPLIPPPRAHQVRYHGILAPGASLRERVVPTAPTAPSRSATHSPVETHPGQPGEACAAQPTNRRARMHWAALLQRVFAVDALRCPRCGSTLRVLAAIEDAAIARAILECLELPARAPPLAPASAEPRAPTPNPDEAFDFDQTPTYEEA